MVSAASLSNRSALISRHVPSQVRRDYQLREVRVKHANPRMKAKANREKEVKLRQQTVTEAEAGFQLFPKLPAEIRLKIWNMASDEPRVVVVYFESHYPNPGFKSPTPVPAALHTCSESREIALGIYELAFSAYVTIEKAVHPPRIYFNFSHDVLYFMDPNRGVRIPFRYPYMELVVQDLERVRRIGVDVTFTEKCGIQTRGKNWKALEVYYACAEKPRLNTKRLLNILPLRPTSERSFIQLYRLEFGRDGRLRGLAPSAAIEKIKEEIKNTIHSNSIKTPQIELAVIGKY